MADNNRKSRRQLRPQVKSEDAVKQSDRKSRPNLVHGRVSTTSQLDNTGEDLDVQVQAEIDQAIAEGVPEEFIITVKEGSGARGVSASKDIRKRSDYQEMLKLIEGGTVDGGTLRTRDVDRLFRTKSMVPVEEFIDLCREHDVIVKTRYGATFDFSLPFNDEMFRMAAKQSRAYIDHQIKLLHQANARRARRGLYHGQPLLVGFIVDRRKKLDDGSDNPSYMRIVPYEPHRKIVREIYRRFRELGGQFNILSHEYAAGQIVFPPFGPEVDPRDINKMQLGRVVDAEGNILGYTLSVHALFDLLTRIEYAGLDKFDGAIITDEQGIPLHLHASLVDFEDWEYAFTRLSFTTLTGEPNLKRQVTYVQTTSTGERKHEAGLLSGLLSSPMGQVQYSAPYYRVIEKQPGKLAGGNTLSVDAESLHFVISQAITLRVLQHKEVRQQISDQAKELQKQQQKASQQADKQIARFKERIKNIKSFIEKAGATLSETDAGEYAEELRQLRSDIATLEQSKQASNKEIKGLDELQELLDTIERGTFGSFCEVEERKLAHSAEGKRARETVRRFLRLATSAIEISEYSAHYIRLAIYWTGPLARTDVIFLHRDDGGRVGWNPEDEEDLRRLYPTADRKELLERFPDRTWGCLTSWAFKLGIERTTRANSSGITDRSTSLLDYQLEQIPADMASKADRWYFGVTPDSGVPLGSSIPGDHRR